VKATELNNAIAAIRDDIRTWREDGSEYASGIRLGLALALIWLCKPPFEPPPSMCPDCYATLPQDGSCCDACGWAKKD
jgi:hypothetical protein